VVLYGCYRILGPYWNTIILAAILAAVFKPAHQKIEDSLKGRKNLAAVLSCIGLTLIVILPLILISLAIIRQGIQSFHAISEWIAAGNLDRLLQSATVQKIGMLIHRFLPDLGGLDPRNLKINQELMSLTSTTGQFLIRQSGQILGDITVLIGKFFILLFCFFFMVRDQERIFSVVSHLLPMSASDEREVVARIKSVARSALLGTLLTAAAQGAAGGLAFWIAGLPGFFWGVMMAFASLIPMIGTALIWIPAAAYLFLSGSWGYGIFLLLWCGILAAMIDNFLRPQFMKGSADMSTFLIFFSILGGVGYFGLIGLLYGPLLFGLAMVLLYLYRLEFQQFLDVQDKR
jgi:predicted PurR-regulated permease PerM